MKDHRPRRVSLRKLKGNSRAVSPIVATILLVFMTVAAGTAFFLFETGWQNTLTKSLDNVQISSTQITMAGSTTVANLMNTFVPAFEKDNVGIKVSYAGSGSGAGLLAVEKRIVNVGMISMEEDLAIPGTSANHPNLIQNIVAYDGVNVFIANATLGAHGITVTPGKSIDMNQTIVDAIYQMNLPTTGTSASSLGVASTIVTPQANQIDIITFGPAISAGTAILTLAPGATVTVNVPIGGLPANAVAAAFQSATMPNGWSATLTSSSNVTFVGPSENYGAARITDSATGSNVSESGFKDGTSITPVNDTLTFYPATFPGTIIVTLPDRITKITVIVTAGESANAIAMEFRSALPSGWSAPAPVGGIVKISGPSQSGFFPSTASNGVSGALPAESGFRDGKTGRPVSDNLTFYPATSPGTIIVTLPDGVTKRTITVTAAESANEVATSFQSALPSGWSAPAPVGGIVKISGPSQSGFFPSTASNGVPGSLPTESSFLDGNAGSRVKDTLVFDQSIDAGSIIVTLPDGVTQVTLVTDAGESAYAVATAFSAALPSGWSANAPVDGNVTISGLYQSGCHPSTAMDGVTGALPTESNFVNGQVGSQAITDTLTFRPASKTGIMIVTLPDGTTKVPVTIPSAPRTAVQVASSFQSALPISWMLVSQVGGTVTFSGPDQSGQPSTAIDLVSGALPIESSFKDGSTAGASVMDTLFFYQANAVGTIVVTLPDSTQVTLVTTAGESANAVATNFRAALPSGWSSPAPVNGNVTISGPTQSGLTKSTTVYVVSGAAPVESGFKDGDTVTPVKDSLTFPQAIAAGTIVVTLPDSTQVTLVTTAGESANAVAAAFRSDLPSGWSAPAPVGGAVNISGPFGSGFGMSFAYDFAPTPPVESGFKDGSNAAAPVTDTLTFHRAIAAGTIIVTLPDKITIITLDIAAGESAVNIATAFRAALPSVWSAPAPVSGNVTISGPNQGGYSNSTAVDVVSGSLPSESNFVNGYSGVQGATDTLTFGPATSVGTFVVTLPDGITQVPVVITSAPKTAVQVASAFQSALPNGWDLIRQIGNAVTFSAPIVNGQPSTAIDGVTGALPVESGFVDGVPITPVMDNLTFSASTSSGTFIVTLPDGVTNVTVVTTAGETANAVAAAFRAALPSGWSAPAQVGGIVTISGPTQSGHSNSTASYGVSGVIPAESGFVDGIPIASVKDNLTFGQATANGNLIVTLPDGTQVAISCTIGETANAIATAFRAALPNGWSAPAPVNGNVTISGPTQSGLTNSTSYDVPSGAMPTESGFVDGSLGSEVKDTLSFGPAAAPGTIIVTLPDGTMVPVIIDAPKNAVQVASAFSGALPSGWNLISQIGNAVAFSASGQTGRPSTAIDVVSGITTVWQNVTNGTSGTMISGSLTSWGGATTGFIKTWADLEAVLLGQGNTTLGYDPDSAQGLNVYYRTDSSDTQDAFSIKALGTGLSGKIGPTLSLTGSTSKGEYGNQALINACMSDPNGIGFGTIGSLRSTPGVQVCNWNGVTPNNQRVIDAVDNYGTDQYALWYPLILVTNGQPTGDVETFINWAIVPSNNLALAHASGFVSLYEAR
jgi:flagellin-like protein